MGFTTKFCSGLRLVIRNMHIIKKRGIDILRDPKLNKGTSFSLNERQVLGIHGLLPPSVNTLDEQAMRVMINLRKIQDDLDRYVSLVALQDRNQTLFYKVITDNVEYCLPIIYTPTVGLACQKYARLFQRPRGLYITIHDKMYIRRILNNWPVNRIKAIVVTDGERILGLGDLGANGMGIPIGKLALYSALAGVQPEDTLPILIDVGTNNQDLLDDPMYLGLRHKRIRGKEYDDFFNNFMDSLTDKYGRSVLIQFEDFGNINAYRLLNKYKDTFCTFNDDIQGTASVALAALLGAGKISGRKLEDNIFLFQGAGSAATGIATLIVQKMVMGGMSEKEAMSKMYMFDLDGLLSLTRDPRTFTVENKIFAKDTLYCDTLTETVKQIKPTVIIGVAGAANVFTPTILQNMAENTERPYIFALSNPTSKCECTAEDAYKHTKGKCIFASGSPFPQFEFNNKTLAPSQCNNSYIFPGVALAIILFKIRPIPNEIFVTAADTLADLVSEDIVASGRIFPSLNSIRNVSLNIAINVAKFAYKSNIAYKIPEPQDKMNFIKRYWYTPQYHLSLRIPQ